MPYTFYVLSINYNCQLSCSCLGSKKVKFMKLDPCLFVLEIIMWVSEIVDWFKFLSLILIFFGHGNLSGV